MPKLNPGTDEDEAPKSVPKAEETRYRILVTALDLFQEKGFEATTMRSIAIQASVATGAAYYYFASKDAIVLAFYRQAAQEMAVDLELELQKTTDVRERIAGLLGVKLRYFRASRSLLSALAGKVDPSNPLSPFSEATRDIREQDIALFGRAISGSKLRVPDDLKPILPRLFWLYQMGIILYWINDASDAQAKSTFLIDKSLQLATKLIQLSGLPLMRPLRRQVVELLQALLD